MSGPLDSARAAYGDSLPDWIEGLAIECGKSSQARVAKAMDRSGATISQVLNNKYKGSLTAIEERYRGVFGRVTVACPALGTMPTHICQDWRQKVRQFQTGNPLRTRMYRACSSCPRYLKEEEPQE